MIVRFEVIISPLAASHITRHQKTGNKILVKRILAFLDELSQHPETGTGKPESMRYQDTVIWSRRIDKKHRLIYEINEVKAVVIALSAYGHYNDK